MNFNLRHNIIALGFLLWLVIGSSARINVNLGLVFLGLFGALAIVYGSRAITLSQIIGGMFGLLLALMWALKNPLTWYSTLILSMELIFWFFILTKPNNLSHKHLGYWIIFYSLTLLLWKLGINGENLFYRSERLINGPIKFGMISSIGYSLLLFQDRQGKNPRFWEICILSLMLLAVLSSLSRTPIFFTLLVTAWYLLRHSTLTLKILAFVGFSILWGILQSTRLLYISQIEGSLLERVLGARYVGWRDALNLIPDDPIWGVGGDAYRAMNYIGLDYPHNIFLELLLNTGIVGLFLFLTICMAQVFKWGSINWGLFAVSMTSGNFFLWMKCIFVYESDKTKLVNN